MRIYAIRKMPLSIDEEESRCTAGASKATGVDGAEGKRFREEFGLFTENLQSRAARMSENKLPT
jgi:hypothetical protein